MPSEPSIRAALRRLAEAKQLPIKARLEALRRLRTLGAPTAMLERLLRDPETPPKLLRLALEMYEARKVVKAWKQRQKSLSALLGTRE
jgi:hypothetical protein